jgi:hypothetical protein
MTAPQGEVRVREKATGEAGTVLFGPHHFRDRNWPGYNQVGKWVVPVLMDRTGNIVLRAIQDLEPEGERRRLSFAGTLSSGKGDLATSTLTGPAPPECDHNAELARLRDHSSQLNSLAWQMVGALGDPKEGDVTGTPVSGSPKMLLDRLIAQRDHLMLRRDQLLENEEGLVDQLMEARARANRAEAELAALRAKSPPKLLHHIKIVEEARSDRGLVTQFECSYPGCPFGGTIISALASPDVISVLAEAHLEDTSPEEKL